MDDDGAGYADIGEEDDWGAETGAGEDAEEGQPAKKQKAGDGKKGSRRISTPTCSPCTYYRLTISARNSPGATRVGLCILCTAVCE